MSFVVVRGSFITLPTAIGIRKESPWSHGEGIHLSFIFSCKVAASWRRRKRRSLLKLEGSSLFRVRGGSLLEEEEEEGFTEVGGELTLSCARWQPPGGY